VACGICNSCEREVSRDNLLKHPSTDQHIEAVLTKNNKKSKRRRFGTKENIVLNEKLQNMGLLNVLNHVSSKIG